MRRIRQGKRWGAGVIIFALALLAGGYGIRQALHGQGTWHELARGLYHAVKGNPAQAARLADQADAALTQATVAVTVDVRAGRHPISPFIYGTAFAPGKTLRDLRVSVNRWGGNDKSRYNWVQGNADNAARDWFFRNRYASDSSVPPGPSSAADRFVAGNKAQGAATLLSVPTIGWVARDSDFGHGSVGVPSSGGEGLSGADGAIAGYDPADNRRRTSIRSVARKNAPFADTPSLAGGVVYQDEWIAHLKKTFGDGAHGGVQFYAMDNEPDLWDSTHTDVHPARMGYDDLLRNFLDYATAVKAVDPSAIITGPVSWGWTGYNYSPLDIGDDKYRTHADRARHGGDPFLLWFLKQTHAHDAWVGQRSLDVLDVHFYPQGDGVYAGRTDSVTDALRLRSTRALWDPSYSDESWIGQPVRLIPRLREWIAQGYPGTKLGITEWNFGADQTHQRRPGNRRGVGHVRARKCVSGKLLGVSRPKTRRDTWHLNFTAMPTAWETVSATSPARPKAPSRAVFPAIAAVDSRAGDLTLILINKMPNATITAPLTHSGLFSGGNREDVALRRR